MEDYKMKVTEITDFQVEDFESRHYLTVVHIM